MELDKSTEISDSVKREFETLLLISHYYATRAAAQANPSLAPIAAKLSVALLRHTDIVPADKAFHEAAMMCKVRLNHCLHLLICLIIVYIS